MNPAIKLSIVIGVHTRDFHRARPRAWLFILKLNCCFAIPEPGASTPPFHKFRQFRSGKRRCSPRNSPIASRLDFTPATRRSQDAYGLATRSGVQHGAVTIDKCAFLRLHAAASPEEFLLKCCDLRMEASRNRIRSGLA